MTIDKQKIKHILILNSAGIGDFIISLPALASIRKSFPSARISFFTGSWQEELARASGLFDEIITWDKDKSVYYLSPERMKYLSYRMFKYIPFLRSRKFDLAIDFHNDYRSRIIIRLIRADVSLGFESISGEEKDIHKSEQYLKLITPFGPSENNAKFNLNISDENVRRTQNFLCENDISATNIIVVIHPQARWQAKIWPKEHFSILANKLMDIAGVKIIFVGVKEDLPHIVKIEGRLKKKPAIAAGKLTFLETAALLKQANLFIGNDAAPMHMAGLFNVPTIALFGPTNHRIFHPLGSSSIVVRKINEACPRCSKKRCVYPKNFCMAKINPNEVFSICTKMLEKNKKCHR